jgi:hypothetical protein
MDKALILDRSYQLELLGKLAEGYPSHLPDRELNQSLKGEERRRYIANISMGNGARMTVFLTVC